MVNLLLESGRQVCRKSYAVRRGVRVEPYRVSLLEQRRKGTVIQGRDEHTGGWECTVSTRFLLSSFVEEFNECFSRGLASRTPPDHPMTMGPSSPMSPPVGFRPVSSLSGQATGMTSTVVGTTAVGSPNVGVHASPDRTVQIARAEMVAWVERALDLGLEGELFPSSEELNAIVDSS